MDLKLTGDQANLTATLTYETGDLFGKIVKSIPIVVKKAEKRPPRKRPGTAAKPPAKS